MFPSSATNRLPFHTILHAAALLTFGFAAGIGVREAKAQKLVTEAPVAKTGGTAFVGKYTAEYVVSAGPVFHFTAPVTITSIAYDAGFSGVQELGIRSVAGCSYNTVIAADTTCSIETEIASHFPGMRYGTLRVTTTSGVFTVPVAFASVGSQVAVTPGTLSTPAGAAGVTGTSLTVDALGNVYLTGSDATIRKIDNMTGAVTIVAGAVNNTTRDGDGGSAVAAHIGYPVDVAASPAGDVYVVSSAPNANDVVRKVDGGTAMISTVTSFETGRVGTSGNGTDGAVVVDDQGNIYTSVTKSNALTVTSGDGSSTRYLIGADPASGNGCNGGDTFAPTTLAVSGGYIYFQSSAAIYKISTDNAVCHAPVLLAGLSVSGNSGDGGLATKAAFGLISGIAVDAAGDVYLADATNNVVRMVSAATGIITTVAGTGSALPGVTVAPSWSSLALDVRGNLYVLSAAGTVQKIVATATALDLTQNAAGSARSVMFTNTGNDVVVNAMPVTSGSFVLDSASTCGVGNAAQLSAGSNCVAEVNVVPQTTGVVTGTLSLDGVLVTLSASDNATVGTTVELSPTSIDFATVPLGKSSMARLVRVTNQGAAPLNLASVILSDTKNFTRGGNCAQSVAAYASCDLTVVFTPQTVGVVHATITLTDNAGVGTQTIQLTGEGTKPSYTVTVTPGELTVQQGQSGTAQFVFAPTGGFAGSVSFACAGLPLGATCSFAPATLMGDGSDKQQTSILTVSMHSQTPAAQQALSGKGVMFGSLLGFNGMLMMWFKLRRKGSLSLKLMGVLLLSLGMAGATGCGSGGFPDTLTPGITTAVRVVATSGIDSQTATLMLTVK